MFSMIIDMRTISHGSRHFEFLLEAGWWAREEKYDQILDLAKALNVRINISRVGDKYRVDGRLFGRLKIRCDRCLEPYKRDIATEFSLFLMMNPSPSGQNEIELLEDDMSVDFITGNEICLDDIVREQIYLSLPMKCLCREDCLGLCPLCGTNLNTGKCNCEDEKGHPGFSKLKNMNLDG